MTGPETGVVRLILAAADRVDYWWAWAAFRQTGAGAEYLWYLEIWKK